MDKAFAHTAGKVFHREVGKVQFLSHLECMDCLIAIGETRREPAMWR